MITTQYQMDADITTLLKQFPIPPQWIPTSSPKPNQAKHDFISYLKQCSPRGAQLLLSTSNPIKMDEYCVEVDGCSEQERIVYLTNTKKSRFSVFCDFEEEVVVKNKTGIVSRTPTALELKIRLKRHHRIVIAIVTNHTTSYLLISPKVEPKHIEWVPDRILSDHLIDLNLVRLKRMYQCNKKNQEEMVKEWEVDSLVWHVQRRTHYSVSNPRVVLSAMKQYLTTLLPFDSLPFDEKQLSLLDWLVEFSIEQQLPYQIWVPYLVQDLDQAKVMIDTLERIKKARIYQQ
jgi:hypothetical protein